MSRIIALITLSFLISFSTLGQELSTPRKALINLFAHLQDANYHPDKAAESIYWTGKKKSKERVKTTIQFKEIFDGSGIILDPLSISNNKNHIDSLSNESVCYVDSRFPELYLKKYGDKWLISKESVAAIDQLHSSVFPLGTDILLEYLPKLGKNEFFGLKTWQYISLLILMLLTYIGYALLRVLFTKVLATLVIRLGYSNIAKNNIIPLSKPIAWFFVFWLMSVFVPVLHLPIKIATFLIIGLRSAMPIIITVIAYRLIDIFADYMGRKAAQTASSLDDQLVPLVRKALKTFVIIIGGLYILQNFNINITTLLAGLSLGGLAFALAAQDTIKNFFGSMMIFVDRPFQIGDWVMGSGVDGTVEEVGFRATRIRTFHNSVTYIPNGHIADMTIDNMGRRNMRRYKTSLGLLYDTPPELMEAFVEGLVEIVQQHPLTYKKNYHIYFNDFAASSLNILFYIFFEVPDWGAELKARHEINLEIVKLAKRIGVSFAFPTQTLHVENFPGQPSLSPVYPGH